MGSPTGTVILEIGVDDPRLPEMFEVLRELRTALTLDQLRAVYRDGYLQGLRYTVVDAAGAIVAVAGWRLISCTSAGLRLYVDDLVTNPHVRSAGHGRLLLAELELRARAAGCSLLTLDSGVQRFDAHRFYFRERMAIAAYHFQRPL